MISQPFGAVARNICCHYHMGLGQQRRPAKTGPFVPQPPSATAREQEVGSAAGALLLLV